MMPKALLRKRPSVSGKVPPTTRTRAERPSDSHKCRISASFLCGLGVHRPVTPRSQPRGLAGGISRLRIGKEAAVFPDLQDIVISSAGGVASHAGSYERPVVARHWFGKGRGCDEADVKVIRAGEGDGTAAAQDNAAAIPPAGPVMEFVLHVEIEVEMHMLFGRDC